MEPAGAIAAFLETFSLWHYASLFFFSNIAGIPVLVYLLFSWLFFLPILYITWMYFDAKTPSLGGRRFQACRKFFLWKYLAHYFPVRLHKTTDLDPQRNYIFSFHPHGVVVYGGFVNFATEATGFSEKFPGIQMHILTLDINFRLPLFRDYLMSFGFGSVAAQSIHYKLTKLGPGNSVMLAPGGAREALLADSEEPYRLKLLNRKGFIREALRAGSPIVPVFSYGESEVVQALKPQPGSIFEKFQLLMLRMFRFIPLLFYGKRFLFPYRVEINTVVGAPMEVPQLFHPSDEDVDLYIEELKTLFSKYQEQYGRKDKNLELF